jgi:hypothetical protein
VNLHGPNTLRVLNSGRLDVSGGNIRTTYLQLIVDLMAPVSCSIQDISEDKYV